MGTLYIAVDLFCPRVYRPDKPVPGAETYGHEDGIAYLILQPAITTADGTDPIAPPIYFSATGSALGTTYNVTFLDHTADPKIGNSAIPVPFPPLTQLTLDLEWTGGPPPVNLAREIPTQRLAEESVDSPFLLKVGDWPEFAVSNFARPAITDWRDLKPAAQAEILSWGVALVPRILGRAHVNDITDPERDAYALLRNLEQEMQNSNAPVLEARVRAYLQASQDGAPRIVKLWTRMLAPDASRGPHAIQAPRYLHDLKSLSTDPVRLLGLGNGKTPIAVSYHYKLWCDIGRLISGSDAERSKGIEALGRLFGFGERLRWPKPQQNDAFMVADPSPTRVKSFDAIGTNAHSILGQVLNPNRRRRQSAPEGDERVRSGRQIVRLVRPVCAVARPH